MALGMLPAFTPDIAEDLWARLAGAWATISYRFQSVVAYALQSVFLGLFTNPFP